MHKAIANTSVLRPLVLGAATAVLGCSGPTEAVSGASQGIAVGPAAFGTLVLFLDANSGVVQSQGAVAEWEDQSGNGNNVSQTAPASQPTFHASGAGPGGALAHVTFGANGSDTFLDNTLKNLVPNGSDVTVLLAASLPRGGVGGSPFTLQRSTPLASFEYENTFDGDYGFSDGVNTGSNDRFAAPPLPVTGGPVLLDYTLHQGTSVALSIDGKLAANGGAATAYTGATGFTVGTREDVPYSGWQGDIDEVLVYQGVLSATNLAAARNYVATEWGIPLAAAADAGACPPGLTLCEGTCVAWQDGAACVPPALPSSFTTPTWFIDPANSTGKASDSNACTAATKPCLTYARIAALWGTYAPRITQNTTITFLSSQPDDSDPVYFNPSVENDAQVTLQGALGPAQQVAAGTLSGVVAKNRATGQLLEATLPAGAAPGQLVVNSTRTSRAWVYKSAGGGRWFLSQPLASNNLAAIFPPENDAWASGDAVALYQPVTVDLAQVMPLSTGGNVGTENLNVTIYQVTVAAGPATTADGAAPSPPQAPDDLQINDNLLVAESSIQKVLNIEAGAKEFDDSFANVDFTQSMFSSSTGVAFTFWGGETRYGSGDVLSLSWGNLDGDFICSGECDVYSGSVDTVFVDARSVLVARSGIAVTYGFGSPPVIWGAGALDVVGNTRFEYPPANPAASVFLETGGLLLDQDPTLLAGGTATTTNTACSVTPAGTWTCGIPLTTANLDTGVDAGGFGGTAIVPGGASITDHGTADSTGN